MKVKVKMLLPAGFEHYEAPTQTIELYKSVIDSDGYAKKCVGISEKCSIKHPSEVKIGDFVAVWLATDKIGDIAGRIEKIITESPKSAVFNATLSEFECKSNKTLKKMKQRKENQ